MRRKSIIAITSVSAAALCAFPAAAQVAAAPVEAQPAIEATEAEVPKGEVVNAEGEGVRGGEIVVTGSRIRRDTYNTDSPVDVITRQDTVLAGSRSTAEVLQSSTVTSGTAQINGNFLGFVSEGGPSANTVGLRGLGAARTLVMLNGRRLAPAGVGPQLIAADLNVLPTTIIQRIEVLREGASSIYGSDAIAGVINVITDNKIDGITLDAYTNQPVEHGGGGRSYRLSGVAGKVFDRGHIAASVEYRELTGMRIRDRDDFKCPRDLFFDRETGQEFGQLDPNTGKPRCFPFRYTPIGTAQNYLLGVNYTRAILGLPGAVNRYAYVDGNIDQLRNVNAFNSRPLSSGRQLEEHVLSPIKTLTGYVNGAYEAGFLGDAEIYGEALFTRRKSAQDYLGQLSIDPVQLGSELYGGTLFGSPIEEYGVDASPFFPNAAAALGNNVLRVFITPDVLETKQKVDYFRGNAGLRGKTGFGDWEYDGNLQFSKTKSKYSIQIPDVRDVRSALFVVEAPAGTPAQYSVAALPGQAGFGKVYTCAGNVTDGAYNSGTCVPLNVFDPAVLAGNLPQGAYDFLYSPKVGHSLFEQVTGSILLDGTLVQLPAGALKLALGGELRHDKLVDTPPEASRSRNFYNYSSVDITKGKDRVLELFGEVDVPIIKDRPMFYELSASGSLRYTDYRSFGSGWTYHLGAQWAPIRNIRLRANYGTSFRAPNLFEQYVGGQSGFGSVDPCDEFASRSAPGDPLYDNCLAELAPILGPDATGFFTTSGQEIFTIGNAKGLDAEKSKSWGLGAILTAPERFADLSLAIDYFNIKVRDQVSQLGGGSIADRCYESEEFRDGNYYCSLVGPREEAQGNLIFVNDPYLNLASQNVSGFDISGRYQTGLGRGKFIANVRATRVLKQEYQTLQGEDAFDYVGLLGYQGTVGGPKWVGDLDMRYQIGNVTFRYGLEYIGSMDTTEEVRALKFDFDLKAERYFEHAASFQYNWKDIGQFTIGVNNLFNAKPATISGYPFSDGQFPRIGNYFNYSGYDFIGRSIFMNVTRSF